MLIVWYGTVRYVHYIVHCCLPLPLPGKEMWCVHQNVKPHDPSYGACALSCAGQGLRQVFGSSHVLGGASEVLLRYAVLCFIEFVGGDAIFVFG